MKHLLAHFPPVDAGGTAAITWTLAGDVSALDYALPTLDIRGMSLFQVINKIVDRKRGIGWFFNSTSQSITIFTHTPTAISLPAGGSIPANSNQDTLDFDQAFNVGRAIVRTNSAAKYTQVRVRGARRGGLCTISNLDGTLVPGWNQATATDKTTKYNQAASTQPGYSALSRAEKQARNDAFRQSDELRRVFSHFNLPSNWNGNAGDGLGGNFQAAIPHIDGDGNVSFVTPADHWPPGLRIAPYIPFLEAADYTGGTSPVLTTPSGTTPEYRRPFFAVPITQTRPEQGEGGSESPVTRWVMIDKLGRLAESEQYGNVGPGWSASVGVQREHPGLVLRVQGEGQQHLLAPQDFLAADDTDDWSANQFVDWRDGLATVYIVGDEHVEAKYPLDSALGSEDFQHVLEISVPDAHLDFVHPLTVVDVQDGQLVRFNANNWIRDDRLRLQNIARVAWEWASISRKTLDVTYRRDLDPNFQLGHLITQIGAAATLETVNTVITQVIYGIADFQVSFKTHYGELDAAGLVD